MRIKVSDIEENNNPNYFGILPANVRYDKKLKPMEKILYTEITALSNSKGYCYATNSYFANLYDVHKNTAGTWINNLEKLGYIKSKIIYEIGTKNVKERQLFIVTPINEKIETYQQKDCDPINKKIDTPINEKIEDNNTRYNNTRYNNINEYNKKETQDIHVKNNITRKNIYISERFKSERFKQTFSDFLEMRKTIKKPATKKAIEMIIIKLEKVNNEEQAIKMLERSIINNWQDVYEIQERGSNGSNNYKSTSKGKREVITRDYNAGTDGWNK